MLCEQKHFIFFKVVKIEYRQLYPNIPLDYESSGPLIKYTFIDFYDYTPIPGCTITCTYANTCGGTFSGNNVKLVTADFPWEISAARNVKPGYIKDLCLECYSNTIFFIKCYLSNIKSRSLFDYVSS